MNFPQIQAKPTPELFRRFESGDPRGASGLQFFLDAWTLQQLGGTYLELIDEWPDLGPNGWHAVQATGASQPRFLPWSNENYLHLPGAAGNYASRAALAPFGTGDFSVSWKGSVNSTSVLGAFIGGGAGCFGIRLLTTNRIEVAKISTASVMSSVAPAMVAGQLTVVGYTRISGVGVIYVDGVAVLSGPDTQDYTVGVSEVGSYVAGAGAMLAGRSLWARVYSSGLTASEMLSDAEGNIQANCVSSFNANDGNANSSAVVSSETGETWTINRSGANPARIVSAPDTLWDGTDDYMSLPAGALGMLRNVPGATVLATRSPSLFTTSRQVFCVGTAAAVTRLTLRTTTIPQYGIGGRRLDANTFAEIGGGAPVANVCAVHAGRINYAAALAGNFANGALVGADSAFQTAGNSDNTDSTAIRIGSALNSTEHWAGSISNLAAFNLAKSNAEIRAMSRYLAARARAGIVIA